MHTAEIEHSPLAQRFAFLRSEDTLIATLASWTVGLGIFTLAGFYFGVVAGHANHPVDDPSRTASIRLASGVDGSAPWREAGRQLHKDIDPTQLIAAWPYAAGGLALGVLFALFITVHYVPTKLRELESEQGHH